MYALGLPIVQGAISTILGVIGLALAPSYIFLTFFKMVLLVIVLGALHGLILLPVLLSFLGPGTYKWKFIADWNSQQNIFLFFKNIYIFFFYFFYDQVPVVAFRPKLVPTLLQIAIQRRLQWVAIPFPVTGSQNRLTLTKVCTNVPEQQQMEMERQHRLHPWNYPWKFQDQNIAQDIVIYFSRQQKMTETVKRFTVTITCKQPPKIRKGQVRDCPLPFPAPPLLRIIMQWRQWRHQRRRWELTYVKCTPIGHLKTDQVPYDYLRKNKKKHNVLWCQAAGRHMKNKTKQKYDGWQRGKLYFQVLFKYLSVPEWTVDWVVGSALCLLIILAFYSSLTYFKSTKQWLSFFLALGIHQNSFYILLELWSVPKCFFKMTMKWHQNFYWSDRGR